MKVLMKEALCQEINASREDVSSHELNKSEFTSTLKDMSDNDGNLFHCSIAQIFQYGRHITIIISQSDSVASLTKETFLPNWKFNW